MTRNNNFTIAGKSQHSSLSLTGCITDQITNNLPAEIQNIKILIMKLIIIPFLAQQWNKLEENICFIDNLSNKIDFYLSIYNDNEHLLLYKDLLVAFETIVFQHMEIKNLEKYFRDEDENIPTLVFKTTMVRLKPEYEIYNLIIGKPALNNGMKYNENILSDIRKLMILDYTNFDTIKTYITNKYIK